MSRVLGVTERSIQIRVEDVVAGDVLYIWGDEDDAIIERVERDEDRVRFHYKDGKNRFGVNPPHSMWMAVGGNNCSIHDLKNERREFEEMRYSNT